jgi:hypothetical protein
MRHLKLFSLLSVPSLALFAAGCGSGNSVGHTAAGGPLISRKNYPEP